MSCGVDVGECLHRTILCLLGEQHEKHWGAAAEMAREKPVGILY
jgi:hypothetical protein